MSMMSSLVERLRQVVGSNNWDYCVIWKLSEDQRFLELVDCCCGNTGNGSDGEEGIVYPCRDIMFQHPRAASCEALAQLPSSHPLDGINMEILISNQPRWLNFSNSNISDLSTNQINVGTKVLIPIPGGLVELFAAKQVNEDQNVIDYVMDQCAILMEQEAMNNCNNIGPSFSESGLEELMTSGNGNIHNLHSLEHSTNKQQQGGEQSSILKQELAGRADPISDSDHLDEVDDDPKYRRRGAKGQQAKNLMAERKRRKKLNERLYHLRSLVPNISKLDRAAILGDAITYVQELKKEADDLQMELEKNSDDEGGADHNNMTNHHHHQHHLYQSNFSSEVSNPLAPAGLGPSDYNNEKPTNGFQLEASESLRRNNDFEGTNDKTQQMEVQVEVVQLEGNDFFVKVFGEQKRGGFVRLMEALNCLGLEITNVNMTSCISLVSYVFIVKKRDSEIVQAEYLRDSLLEATRSQVGLWTEMARASSDQNAGGIDQHHHHHPHPHHRQHPHSLYQPHSHQHHLHHPDHISPFQNHFHHLNN